MAKKPSWYVRLGDPEWARHTYARPADDALHLLGSVRRGQQVGALAKTDAGEFVQVVGDFIIPLNKRKIESALARAGSAPPMDYAPRTAPKPAAPPVIIVKRRRIPVMT